MGFMERGWNGDEKCWKVIWVYGVLFIFLAKLCAVAICLVFPVDYVTVNYHGLFLTLLRSVYTLWLFVSVWRCAADSDWKITTFFVRFLLIFFLSALGALSYYMGRFIEPWEVTCYDDFMHNYGGVLRLVGMIVVLYLKRWGIHV
jgi:hypothetical protein